MSVREFFSELGVTLPGNATTGSVSVPCFANPSAHNHEDRRPSCSVNLDTGQWRCHGCGAHGGAYDAAVARGQPPSVAADLAKRHGLFVDDREQTTSARPRTATSRRAAPSLPSEAQVRTWREALLGNEMLLARLFELRGWTREAIGALELGIDGNRVTFPIRNADSQLVGLLRYAPNPAARKGPKMLAAKGTPRQLFPPPETLPADATLHLVEGEPDAVAMRSLGLASVAVPGVQGWRPEWAPRFAGRHVVLTCDLDADGRELMAQAGRDLLPHAATVRVVDMDASREDGGDVGDLVREAAQDGASGLAEARALIEPMAGDAAALAPSSVAAPQSTARGRIVTFTRASEIRHVRVRWLWRGRVPLGAVTVLAGQQGLGKSTTMIELAARLTRGELDGDLAGRPCRVLIVTLEDNLSGMVNPRLIAAGADLDQVEIVGVKVDGLDGLITLPEDIAAIDSSAREQAARLLIIDPIVAALSGGIDAYRDHEVRRAFAPLAQLAERNDLAVVAIMHLTKAQTGDLLGRVSGSVAFTAAARSVLAFARDPDDPDGDAGDRRVIVHIKSNWGRMAPSLLAEVQEHHIDDDPPDLVSRLVILGESPLTAEDFAGGRHDAGDRADRDAAVDLIAVETGRRRHGTWQATSSVRPKSATSAGSTAYRAAHGA